ncbi:MULTISPECIES: mycofactocin-coupled SDR family oxidoreductase [Mycolicibacterium]|jgi:SDR family mycofactocin-dependent oxidoreductase|uniref:SDR family mycofactocin-dependent oxidoreductase n=1 Tax=Mycolicibacterium phocaicum TaxID=319706 RepID=A0A7I7ZUV5_9MYCO|nr:MULTISPECIES: mycofactocin-coupled SDR family oxidoreductase [Mycolicibacterium]TXH21642.1 MAG: NAD(P)-dependent oxidoreductase [Mycobacterium sp.]SHU51603.1 oxidoreductase, SDR family [Mycobacteroides abscessus subsp. abscessus]RUP27979.1 MAG: NAD(P)-dependent oxidoreductase [Mycolicibacterium sp.]TLH63659.1 SDR family mycofactocin-dependent oxidoreductase [Mycolicibacterium phocaicum]UCZ59434.1 mycofactocin-coupled SDR family oxidoreductase [Mycolicibacterium phocaicum]
MAGQFEGKVAFITGAARGQGRSHAVRFAEEGADIIAVDLCDQIASVGYPMSTREDLDETVNLVEKTGRRIVAETGDVRDFERLKAIVADGVAELGRLDFVLANAGILPGFGEQRHEMAAFDDSVAVLLNGVYYTIEAALPYLLSQDEGGAIVITSSTAGLNSLCPTLTSQSRGMAGYHAGKHGVVGLMRYYATSLAEKNIRVNTVHPTGVATPMILNEGFAELVAEHPEDVTGLQAPLPVELIDPSDVSEAMVYLCGRSGRYITGITLPVDGGISVK